MNILQIYEKYKIPSLLQFHQLRAASVGKLIADHWTKSELIDKNSVIEELLLHDMGNIIKFNLEDPSKLLDGQTETIEDLRKIQKKFIEKYGKDEHEATYQIGKEIGVSDNVLNLLSRLKSTEDAEKSSDYNIKICFYSDLRCGPYGILSVDKRFDDLLARYKGRNHPIADIDRTENNRKHTHNIQNQLQEFTSFDLKTIDDKSVSDNIDFLKDYNLT